MRQIFISHTWNRLYFPNFLCSLGICTHCPFSLHAFCPDTQLFPSHQVSIQNALFSGKPVSTTLVKIRCLCHSLLNTTIISFLTALLSTWSHLFVFVFIIHILLPEYKLLQMWTLLTTVSTAPRIMTNM